MLVSNRGSSIIQKASRVLSLPGGLGLEIFTFGIPASTGCADWVVCPKVAMEISERLEEYREESGNNIAEVRFGVVLVSKVENVKGRQCNASPALLGA